MLPRFCRGEELVCFAITETDVGSNTLNIKTRARFCSERYRFSGPKDFTTAADACHHVMTLARTTPREEVANGNEGSTVFLVPLDVPLPIPERYCQRSSARTGARRRRASDPRQERLPTQFGIYDLYSHGDDGGRRRRMRLSDLPFQAMGSQPAFAPADLERFVAAPRIAILSYVKRDGTPAQAPVWYRYADGRFALVTSRTSPKARALARSGRACLTIQDEMPPYRAVIIDGDVTIADAPLEGGITSWLATHYFGRLGGREYEKMTLDGNRKTGLVAITIDPIRVRGFDNHRLVGRGLRLYMRLRESLPLPRSWF